MSTNFFWAYEILKARTDVMPTKSVTRSEKIVAENTQRAARAVLVKCSFAREIPTELLEKGQCWLFDPGQSAGSYTAGRMAETIEELTAASEVLRRLGRVQVIPVCGKTPPHTKSPWQRLFGGQLAIEEKKTIGAISLPATQEEILSQIAKWEEAIKAEHEAWLKQQEENDRERSLKGPPVSHGRSLASFIEDDGWFMADMNWPS